MEGRYIAGLQLEFSHFWGCFWLFLGMFLVIFGDVFGHFWGYFWSFLGIFLVISGDAFGHFQG